MLGLLGGLGRARFGVALGLGLRVGWRRAAAAIAQDHIDLRPVLTVSADRDRADSTGLLTTGFQPCDVGCVPDGAARRVRRNFLPGKTRFLLRESIYRDKRVYLFLLTTTPRTSRPPAGAAG